MKNRGIVFVPNTVNGDLGIANQTPFGLGIDIKKSGEIRIELHSVALTNKITVGSNESVVISFELSLANLCDNHLFQFFGIDR